MVFPWRICYKSAQAIHSPHPGIKIGSKCQQIPLHARAYPRGRHPLMVADTCIIVGSLFETTFKIPASWTSQDSENDLLLELIQERPSIDGRSRELQPRTKLLRQFHQFPNICALLLSPLNRTERKGKGLLPTPIQCCFGPKKTDVYNSRFTLNSIE